MQNKIILAALLFALSTSAAVAQSESSSTTSNESDASQTLVSEAGDKVAADSKPAGTPKDSAAASEKSAKPEAKVKQKEEKPKAKAAKTSSTKSSSSNDRLADAGKFVANGTKRVAATMTGFAIGMPIATIRIAIHEDGEQAKCLPFLSESDKPPLVWVSRFLFIPTAAFSGLFQAPVFSATNAWRESDENPFSKESIFLGDYDERATQQ